MKEKQAKKNRKLEFLKSKYGESYDLSDLNIAAEDINKEQLKKEWNELKKNQIKYSDMCQSTINSIKLTNSSLDKIKFCGNYLEFLANKSFDKHKLIRGSFCCTRLCPTCAKRKSLRWIFALSLMIEYVNSTYDYEYLLLTLTAPNVKGDDLHDQLTKYSKAFDNMLKRKKYKAIDKGFIRKLEITYNKKTDTYHPHYHVIIAVNKSYFKDKDLYIKRDTWLKDWQHAMKDDSITQVDIRKVYNKSTADSDLTKSSIQTGILEVAKYTAKSGDYLISEDVFIAFWNALKYMREFTFGGCFKEAHNLFKLGELDELIPEDETKWFYRLIYRWSDIKMSYSDFLTEIKTNEDFEKDFDGILDFYRYQSSYDFNDDSDANLFD